MNMPVLGENMSLGCLLCTWELNVYYFFGIQGSLMCISLLFMLETYFPVFTFLVSRNVVS